MGMGYAPVSEVTVERESIEQMPEYSRFKKVLDETVPDMISDDFFRLYTIEEVGERTADFKMKTYIEDFRDIAEQECFTEIEEASDTDLERLLSAWHAVEDAFFSAFMMKLYVQYHDPDIGGPHDDVEGIYFAVPFEAFYSVTPNGKALKEKMDVQFSQYTELV